LLLLKLFDNWKIARKEILTRIQSLKEQNCEFKGDNTTWLWISSVHRSLNVFRTLMFQKFNFKTLINLASIGIFWWSKYYQKEDFDKNPEFERLQFCIQRYVAVNVFASLCFGCLALKFDSFGCDLTFSMI
jgi:hypothetical protein